uniref:C2H2-type domain-containing protein n=1 Tax=Caenorhabditis tropicalis TaxID=1561998 RepID=A0A1I7TD17_9PELO
MVSAKTRKNRTNSTSIDSECVKKLNLLYICGYCSKIIGDGKEFQQEHAQSHENEITQCRTCILPIKLNEKKSHLKKIHRCNYRLIKFSLDKSLIELRIAAGKSFSNFWGLSLSSSDRALQHFRSVSTRWWNNFKNGRSIGCFRVIKSKIFWSCSICIDTKPATCFDETLSMRAYTLSHLERFHLDELMVNIPGFLEFEWFHLQEEADFDIRSLMELAAQRSQIRCRSYRTFYTINLGLLESGDSFLRKIHKKDGWENKEVRYCLICCCLIPLESIRNHFGSSSHKHLEAVAESTSFLRVYKKSEDPSCLVEGANNEGNEVETCSVEEEIEQFEFPRELFLYEIVFKNQRQDEFKWRCCLCPRAHAQTFATQIIMRMYALRHIDEHHKFLFTEEFLAFEWFSVQHEMRASFDIRMFTPQQYTEKGEGTFNIGDPNDFVLPQQYYFLPKGLSNTNVICGFCYRSFNRRDFLLHIPIHGFGILDREPCELRPVVLNQAVRELMGQHNYSDDGLEDEPINVLSVDGKRLKSKMQLANQRTNQWNSQFSEFTTPMRSETEGEMNTPRRKSAMDAKKLLTETFKILQENARNRVETWNESSCSSSSDEDNSEDERFEKELSLIDRKTLRTDRIETIQPKENQKIEVSRMKPTELRLWVQREAEKRGLTWNTSDSTSSDSEDEIIENKRVSNKWSTMKPGKIKEIIRNAAKKRRIEFTNGTSSSSSDSGDNDI